MRKNRHYDSIFLLLSVWRDLYTGWNTQGCVGRGGKQGDCYGRGNCALKAWINPCELVRVMCLLKQTVQRGHRKLRVCRWKWGLVNIQDFEG